MNRPQIVIELLSEYLTVDFNKSYLGSFAVSQEKAKQIAEYIHYLEECVVQGTPENCPLIRRPQ